MLHATTKVEVEFDASVWTDVSAYTRLAAWDRGRNADADQFPAGRARVVLANKDRRFDPEHASGPYYGKLLPRKRLRITVTYAATPYVRFLGYIDGWPQSYTAPRDATVTVTATDAWKVLAGAGLPSAWQQTIAAESTVTAWYRLGESSGTAAADASGNKLHGVYEGGATFNSRTGLIESDSDNAIGFDGIDDYVALPFAAAVDTANPFTIEFWIEKSSDLTIDDEVVYEQSQGQSTDAPGVVSFLVRGTTGGLDGQINFAHITAGADAVIDSGVRVDDGARHHVAAVASGGTVSLYVDAVLVGTDGYTPAASTVSWLRVGHGRIGSGGSVDGYHLNATVDELILHDAALSDATILAHYTAGTTPWEGDTPKARIDRVLDYVGWPAGDRDLDTGTAVLVAADLETDALSHNQEVELTEGGRLFIDRQGRVTLIGRQNFWAETVYNTSNATFGDSGGELPYRAVPGDLFGFDDDRIVNEARVRQANGSEQVAADAASQAAYGVMTTSESTLEQRPGVVQNRAEYLVFKGKDPVLRMPKVEIAPERSPAALYPILLAADLGYRYTFKRRPQAVGTAISKEFHLEGESWTVTPDRLDVRWELSPAEPAFGGWDAGTWETGANVFRWAY